MGITKANGSTKLIHTIDLNDYGLGDVPLDEKGAAKQDVADYLKNEIIRTVHKGDSPVKGESKFQRLDTKYAKKEKGGVRLANLQLEGDLLDSFKVTPSTGSLLKVGHEGGQVPKADGHNQASSKAKTWAAKNDFPKRRYIPATGQVFDDKITNEIRSIIKEYVPDVTDSINSSINISDILKSKAKPSDVTQTTENVAIGLDNFLNDASISQALADELLRRQ